MRVMKPLFDRAARWIVRNLQFEALPKIARVVFAAEANRRRIGALLQQRRPCRIFVQTESRLDALRVDRARRAQDRLHRSNVQPRMQQTLRGEESRVCGNEDAL